MPNLTSQQLCTGCTACAHACLNHCIEMIKDEYGFVYPQIADLSACIECGQCENTCPVLNKQSLSDKTPQAYAAFSLNENMRMESSSGGIFTELAGYIIDRGGVVFGAAYGENFRVKHICVENRDDLRKLRGAKYAESDLGGVIPDILSHIKKGQKVLFSGTPCQVAGVKAAVGDDENLFCIDFVCHGVPSPKAWQAYVKYRAETDANGEYPIDINLRSKRTGWSRYRYSNLFEYKNNITYSVSSGQSLFMKLFVGDYISRESCEKCSFKGYERASDITLGDFWGIWDIAPSMDDNKGTSVVLVQSEKGRKAWRYLSGKIKSKEVSHEDASMQNPSMLLSSKANGNRQKALQMMRDGNIEECSRFFTQPKPSAADRIKGKIKRILGA